jgi:putative ABC transport system permease protein
MSFWIDIKYTLRLLLKKPVFTATSVLIVAIGLGLTLYTYSLLSQLIYKPLTMNGDTPLISIQGQPQGPQDGTPRIDSYHLNQVKAESDLIQNLSMYRRGTNILGDFDNQTNPKKLNAVYTQWNLFEVTGVQPILGRGFRVEDQAQGGEPLAVIGYRLWQDSFSGNMDIVNTSIKLTGQTVRVIGVMPKGFAFPDVTQIWRSLDDNVITVPLPNDEEGQQMSTVVRLKQGVSLEEFQQELKVIEQKNLQNLPPELDWRKSIPGGYMKAFPHKLTDDSVFYHYSIFIAMMIVVLLILVMTSINIGNLLLVRVNERIKEVAIRISLGVPRKRLILQMLLESTVICCLGGLLAFFLATWGTHITNSVFDQVFAINGQKPFWWHLSLDMDAIGVLLATISLMILVTGLLPAWRALTGDMNAILRDGTRGALGKKASRSNLTLVVAEIALSCVVLVIATMLLSTNYMSQDADYGTETENRLTAETILPYYKYPWHDGAPLARKKRNDFYYQLIDELEQLPNIYAASYFTSLPGTTPSLGPGHFEIEGREADVLEENPTWIFEVVSREPWKAVGMKIIEGRGFDPRGSASPLEGSPVVISEGMARDLFPNGDAIGQRLRHAQEGWRSVWRPILGITSDTVHGLNMQATSTHHNAYGLMDLNYFPFKKLVIHYSGSQSQVENALMETVRKMDPDVSVSNIRSYDELIKQPTMKVNTVNTIFLWCGLIALFLAASGIYAVAANSITLRSQEIATRRALGAKNGQIIKLFLGQACIQLLFGLALGISLAILVINQITQSMMIDINSYVIGLVGMPILIIFMVLIATYIPASKITEKEPGEGLREC